MPTTEVMKSGTYLVMSYLYDARLCCELDPSCMREEFFLDRSCVLHLLHDLATQIVRDLATQIETQTADLHAPEGHQGTTGSSAVHEILGYFWWVHQPTGQEHRRSGRRRHV
jgi:hypothetical protein